MSKWNDMSSAPKDQTWILVKVDGSEEEWDPKIYIVQWRGEWLEWGSEPWGVRNPLGWMHLPER